MLLAALLFDLIYRDTADKTKATRTAGAVFAACLIALGVFYATVFVQIKDYSVGREAYVQAQIDRGEKKIYLPMYPAYTGDYIRGSTPKDGSVWEERYKMFYHIDPNIDLVTVGPNTPQAKAVLAQELWTYLYADTRACHRTTTQTAGTLSPFAPMGVKIF